MAGTCAAHAVPHAGGPVLEQLQAALQQQGAPTAGPKGGARSALKARPMALLVLDELDALMAKDAAVLVDLFRLAHVRPSVALQSRVTHRIWPRTRPRWQSCSAWRKCAPL